MNAAITQLQRAEAGLARPWSIRAIAAFNILILLAGLAPFVLWETFGPGRFEALRLGSSPHDVAAAVNVGDHPGKVDKDGSQPHVLPEPTLAMPHIPLNLGPSVRVTLIFSVGSKGLDQAEANRLNVVDLNERGADGLTDTMMVLVADTASRQAALLSLPRDLWVWHRGSRINSTFNRRGTQALVDDVTLATGLPVNSVVRLNFSAFADLVDAVGGVALPVDRPLADLASVLYVPRSGCWRFDGPAALAYVRSRKTLTRSSSGEWVSDSSASDFGRIRRQQALVGAIWDQIRGPSVIPRIPALISSARQGLVVDQNLGIQDVRDLASTFGDIASGRIENYTLPTSSRRIGRAAAQVLNESAAESIIRRLRSWPPDSSDAMPAAQSGSQRALPNDQVAVALGSGPVALPTGCSMGQAFQLPDPRGPLGVIAGGGDPQVTPPEPAENPSGSEEPSEEPSIEPTRSEEPTEPEPSESESTGGIDLPLPIGRRPSGNDP